VSPPIELSSSNDASDGSFDLLTMPMPQAGSSRIVFASNRGGSMQIYLMNGDGSGQTRLTYSGANDEHPRWSPDGSKILFQSDRDNAATGYMDIYVMNANGSGVTRLTSDPNDDSAAVWSPDGTKIAFQSFRNGIAYQVYVMNADGSGQINISNGIANDSQPSWSPNGTKIAFASDRDQPGFSSIYVMNANGSSQTRLTVSGSGLRDEQPAWSSNGAKLAFTSTRDSILETWQETDDAGAIVTKSKLHVNKEIYSMNADGSGQTRLTNELANDDSANWSPDGTKIIFRSERERDCCDPTAQVWTMNSDGSGPANLSGNGFGDSAPVITVVGNQAPIANAGGPYTAFTAQTITFNGGGSFDPDGIIASYAWNFGDGGTGSGTTPTHSYTTAGTYNVTLTVTDNSGATASAAATATITRANQPPIANPGGPYTAFTAQTVTFNGGGSSDPDGTIAGYSWNFGDGGSGSGVTPTHVYTAAGTYTVSLTVTDNQGAQASASTTASITTATADYFTQNFIQVALNRTPNPDEVNYWEDIFRAAYAHQQGSMMIAVREMARTVFESAEYAGRGRDNHWYVYDLYETYLMRYPDASGWGFWEGQCNAYGREQVRRAFDECGEFAGYVASIQPTGSASSGVYSLQGSRVSPENQTGDQLLARDAEWSASLLSLPGRTGLDLGLGLSYSSAVWTRSGPYAYFDEDNGTLSPGFRLGFPTVQEAFFDAQAGVNVRPLVTSSGRRVELRQIGATNVYEAADSSYLQLIDYGSSLTVRSPDGTQMSYSKFLEWQCTQIKDRNGNYITVNYDWRGDIQNIVDTLGRTITFNYDPNANLTSITQSGRTQPWATFGWGTVTMAPALSGVVGTRNGEIIPVLASVSFADGTYDKFLYNPSGQVVRITHYASDSNPATDNHERAHTVFNYGASDDITRLTSVGVSAENWTGINGVPGEVVTQYGTEGTAHVLTAPDGTTYKEFYGSGWQRGLTVQSQVWAGGSQQKSTTTAWQQDNPNVSYQTNPRATETNVIDSAGNHGRTTIAYTTFALPNGSSCSLPADVYEYEANATTVARRSHTDYNLDAAYLNARVIGLPQAKLLYEGASTLMAKSTYVYDSGGEFLQGLPAGPIQHDGNYSTDYVVGRANLVDVLRWDATDPTSLAKALESKVGYDIAGSIIFTRDALNHQTSISYTDAFSANGTDLDAPRSFATFAYPTTVTDADGYSSSVRYRYDLGVATWKQTPKPNEITNMPGPEQTFEYDLAVRLKRVANLVNGAYTKYEYGPNYVHTYSTVNNVADEAYSAQIFDGLGRVIAAVRNHPGSTGLYSAVVTIYDQMGRAIQQSNPTETTASGSWPAVGDDAYNATTGEGNWRYTQQSYDWKGRPRITTNADLTQRSASYSVCGCAGSDIVSLTDEIGRQQKLYNDVFGRTAKTEVLNWNGTVYSTTVNTYNARDQVTAVRQYQGAEGSAVYQDTTMSYDGRGRLQSKHVPEQDANTATIWDYNNDDMIHAVTDARGATATYTYNNNRGLVNGIAYSTPSGATPTASVSFGYDALGKRISMADGLGSVSYNYDQLSRLSSETRYFSALSSSPTGGNYGISYQYNLANELTSVTDPFGAQMSYNRDTAGRVASVTGAGFLGISTYASNIQYRAWGAQKSVTYGDGNSATTNYNSRMQPSSYQMPGLREQFQYYADGRLQTMTDLDDRNQDIGYPDTARHFSRVQSYDQVGRLTAARGAPSTYSSFPYDQSYGYDAFGNSTSRSGWYYYQSYSSDGGNFQNNRRQDLSYDADGNVTHTPSYNYAGGSVVSFRDWTYDAAGRMIQVKETATANSSVSTYISNHDGDGQPVIEYYQANPASKSYMVRSSVLGGEVLTRLDNAGNKWKSTFSVDGLLRVVQYGVSYYTQYATLQWTHIDPLGLSEAGDTKAVYDPTGNYIQWQHAPTAPPNAYPPIASSSGGLGAGFGSAQDKSCVLNGEPISCSDLEHQTDTGNVAVDYLIMDSQGLRHVQGDVTSKGLGLLVVDYPRDNQDGGYELLHKIVTLPQKSSKDDCQRLADIVEQIARETLGTRPDTPGLDVQTFMDQLATTFTEFPAATLAAVTGLSQIEGRSGNQNPPRFGSSGFHPDYFEPDVVTADGRHIPSNQVRHAVGGLIAGYVGLLLHDPITGNGMNDREDPNDPLHGVPDINLNNKTVPYGARIATPSKGPSLMGPRHIGGAEAIRGLPDWIRNTLCSPWSKS
jgi:YD repeat-containing protein